MNLSSGFWRMKVMKKWKSDNLLYISCLFYYHANLYVILHVENDDLMHRRGRGGYEDDGGKDGRVMQARTECEVCVSCTIHSFCICMVSLHVKQLTASMTFGR